MCRHFLTRVLVSAVPGAKPWCFGSECLELNVWVWKVSSKMAFLRTGLAKNPQTTTKPNKKACYPCFLKNPKGLADVCQESSWAVVLSPAPLLQHGGLVFLCPCGVLPTFGRCKLRKYFTLRLCGLLWYLPLAGGQQFYPAGAASLLCWHQAPGALDLTCSCVGGESQFPGFPDSFPGGSQERFSCPTFLLFVPCLWRSKNYFWF